MINNILNEAIDLIDDDLISNAYSDKSVGKSYKKYVAVAAAFVILIVAAVIAVNNTGNKPSLSATGAETTTDTLYYGGAHSEEISDGDIVVEGTAFTDDEIVEYLEEHKYDIVGAIAAEYGDFESEYRIITKGYCHVSLGATNTLHLNAVTLPVSVNGKIVSNVTVLKEGDRIIQSISLRGEGFNRLNRIIEDNKDAELAFFYVDGMTEVVILPSNSFHIISGRTSVSLDDNVDYYGRYKTDKNVFSYGILTDDNCCIKVTPLPEEEITAGGNSQTDEFDYPEQPPQIIQSTTKASINLTLDDILSKNVSSIEWTDSYELLSGKSYHGCSEKEKADIISILSNIEFTENPDFEEKFGGIFYVKLIFDDGSYASVALLDEDFYIETLNGQSPIYTDATENTVKLIYYLAERK